MTTHDTASPLAPCRPPARPPWGLIGAALAVGALLGAAGHALWADHQTASGAGAGAAGAAPPDPAAADTVADQARRLASQSQFAAALPWFRQALALRPADASLLADTAETLLNLNGQALDGEPAALVALALALDPANLKALVLAANAAAQHDAASAAALWTRALAAVPAHQPDLTRQFQARLDDAQRGLAAPAPPALAATATAAAASTAPAAASAPTGASAAVGTAMGTTRATPAATAPEARASTRTITGTVSIATEIEANLQPGDLVLITVKADGSSTPLATLRQRVKDLPYRFSLPTDGLPAAADAAQRLVVQARISRAEHATPQAGDWRGQSTPVAPGSSGVRVEVGDAVR